MVITTSLDLNNLIVVGNYDYSVIAKPKPWLEDEKEEEEEDDDTADQIDDEDEEDEEPEDDVGDGVGDEE